MADQNIPVKYFDFSAGLMDRLFDANALIDLVLKSEEPEIETDLSRAIAMAQERICGVINSLDGSSVNYEAKTTVDMMQSALQADSIKSALIALLQAIPEDQTDTIGSLKTVLKLAYDLSTHLASGGQYKYVLKEVLDEAKVA